MSNESLSLSLCGLLSFHRSDTARCVHDREHVSNVSRCSRGEENTGGVFSRVSAIAFSPPLSPPRRQIDFHRDRDWKAAGPDNRKPGLRVYADFSFHGAAYADAVVFPVCPRGRRRVCLSTSAPRRPRYSTYPLRLCTYMLCVYVCVYVHLCV